jgi:hypothetical protein
MVWTEKKENVTTSHPPVQVKKAYSVIRVWDLPKTTAVLNFN